ncbi:isochorismatase family protein [Latilactobacillus curvatus]|uniref:Isochorismatase-like domain-containing protein n=1 Tax=Latilactobacillus curvatus TaxID=28038 RepID=A0ABN6GI83_LATCU|nr:isochorismatase family protein [Latilactobacillus curvatus]BBE27000.1 hypothetical protein NFHkm12_18260 [Latilactobacillus curvatus]BCX30531.1 hypothetical protein LTWDN19_10980 [Latilactobacillus curvatus]
MLKLADCLLVIDLQNGVCKSEQPVARLNQLIKGVNARIDAYQAESRPIIFVQHNFVQHNDKTLIAGQSTW